MRAEATQGKPPAQEIGGYRSRHGCEQTSLLWRYALLSLASVRDYASRANHAFIIDMPPVFPGGTFVCG